MVIIWHKYIHSFSNSVNSMIVRDDSYHPTKIIKSKDGAPILNCAERPGGKNTFKNSRILAS